MKSEKKAVIFDMDGTLWDSVDGVVASWNSALERMGEEARVTAEFIMGMMGQTMDKFAEAIFPDRPLEEGLKALQVLETEENEYLRENGAGLLGDAAQVFEALHEKDYMVGIVTNAQAGYAEAFLDHFDLRGLVDDYLNYGDTFHGKADNIRLMMERNGVGHCVYVGDTEGDRQACLEAGVPFIWAAYGFGDVETPVQEIHSLEEILEVIDNI